MRSVLGLMAPKLTLNELARYEVLTEVSAEGPPESLIAERVVAVQEHCWQGANAAAAAAVAVVAFAVSVVAKTFIRILKQRIHW